MESTAAIKLFEQKQVRNIWSDDAEKWYFSVADGKIRATFLP
jgi:hypothetical protein